MKIDLTKDEWLDVLDALGIAKATMLESMALWSKLGETDLADVRLEEVNAYNAIVNKIHEALFN
jgi:hypothetical protein